MPTSKDEKRTKNPTSFDEYKLTRIRDKDFEPDFAKIFHAKPQKPPSFFIFFAHFATLREKTTKFSRGFLSRTDVKLIPEFNKIAPICTQG